MPWIRAATDSCEGMRLVILFCLSEFSRFGEMAALRLDEMTHVKEEIGEIYPFSVEGGGRNDILFPSDSACVET